jgi:hypothetical protein
MWVVTLTPHLGLLHVVYASQGVWCIYYYTSTGPVDVLHGIHTVVHIHTVGAWILTRTPLETTASGALRGTTYRRYY